MSKQLQLTKDQIDHASLSDLIDWTFTADAAINGSERHEPYAVALGLVKRQKGGGIKPTKLYRYLTDGE